MTHAKSSRNLKLEWLRLQRRRIRSLLVLGKAVPSSANHRSKGDENSSSRVGFTLWLIRVLYVIINDFCHQRFSRELLFVHEGKKVLMIWRLGSSLMPWGSVLWELFGSSKVQILQTSKGNTGLRRDDPSQKWSPINTSVLIINVESLAWRSLSVVRETHGKRKGLNEMRKSESLWLESVMCNLNSHDPSKGRASTSAQPLGHAYTSLFLVKWLSCPAAAVPFQHCLGGTRNKCTDIIVTGYRLSIHPQKFSYSFNGSRAIEGQGYFVLYKISSSFSLLRSVLLTIYGQAHVASSMNLHGGLK